VLGVHRPGYLSQEGRRLTQFPDPGHKRSCVFFLSFFSAHPFSLRCSRVGSKNVNYPSRARIKSNKNAITVIPSVYWRGIETDNKWNEKKQVTVIGSFREMLKKKLNDSLDITC